ncbi:hypothetical protein PROFUN_14212 [Planoprotostelium fungivorum]|uniref:Uncharacterized protein n=1 Tax=Planoprotostelium fungivorum TaxID=1890364 RepID=A0A2P6N0Q9_9EUKA|nr:hypothetical protein PROFUN_14212 [Planoprotostelium fungivorum]
MGTYHNLGRAPGTKTHGLPKNGFRFFVRTVITEKSDNVCLKNSVERHMAYTLVPSNFSSGHLHQSKVRITLNNSVRTLNSSVIWTFLKLGIVFVTRVTYHWNQRISESQNQVQKHMGYPKMGGCQVSFLISMGRCTHELQGNVDQPTVQPLPSEIKARRSLLSQKQTPLVIVLGKIKKSQKDLLLLTAQQLNFGIYFCSCLTQDKLAVHNTWLRDKCFWLDTVGRVMGIISKQGMEKFENICWHFLVTDDNAAHKAFTAISLSAPMQ